MQEKAEIFDRADIKNRERKAEKGRHIAPDPIIIEVYVLGEKEDNPVTASPKEKHKKRNRLSITFFGAGRGTRLGEPISYPRLRQNVGGTSRSPEACGGDRRKRNLSRLALYRIDRKEVAVVRNQKGPKAKLRSPVISWDHGRGTAGRGEQPPAVVATTQIGGGDCVKRRKRYGATNKIG